MRRTSDNCNAGEWGNGQGGLFTVDAGSGMGNRSIACSVIPAILLLAAAGSPAQELRVEPRVTARWEYSDNMFLSFVEESEADAEPVIEQVEDSFWTLTPGLSAGIHGRYISLTLRGDAGRTVYDKYPELNGWRYDLGLGMAAGVAPDTTLSLRHHIQRTDQPLRMNPATTGPSLMLPDEPGADDTLSVRERYSLHDTTASLMYRPGDNDLLGAGYSYSTRESTETLDGYSRSRGNVEGSRRLGSGWDTRFLAAYSQADFDRGSDADQWDGRLEIGRPFARDWSWMARYQHSTVNTEGGEEGDTPSGNTGYQVLNPEVGVTCNTRHGGSLELSAGVFRRVPDEGGDSTTAISGSFSMNRAFERGSLILQARTGHEDRIFNRERLDSTRYYTTGAGADYALTRALAVGGMVFYRWDEYDLDPASEANRDYAPVTSADSSGTSLTMRYNPKDWLAANITYTYSDQYSLTLRDRYTENRVMFLLTFSLPYQTGRVPARRQPLEVPDP